jgi:glyoxylase-like metal-dependent hydrolase (beta-lactamase superfamily II)
MLEIIRFVLGPVQTNSYLIADPELKQAAVIDPAWDGQLILDEAQKRGWRIGNIWLTHAHFDHFGGAAAIADGSMPMPPVALHPQDYTLWRAMGGAQLFGMQMDPGPEPTIDLQHGQLLFLGENELMVRHAPGHTPGHVGFYSQTEKVVSVAM